MQNREFVEELIDLVQMMASQSGMPADFDSSLWVSEWLVRPLPALGGATPESYISTGEGQDLVRRLLAMGQSGAYA
jgi:hypothetical protein